MEQHPGPRGREKAEREVFDSGAEVSEAKEELAVELPMPVLVPQPHGGALLSGGVPGHDGSNAGAKKSTVREKCREGFEAALPYLTRIAKGKTGEAIDAPIPAPGESIRALDVLGKYGLGEAKVLVPDELAECVVKVLASCDFLSGAEREDIAAKLDEALKAL
jgi:hypothetical protein